MRFFSQCFRRVRNFLLPGSALLAASVMLVSPLIQAAPPAAPEMSAEQSQKVEQFKQLQLQLEELQQQLNAIQEATLDAHPELAQQQQEFKEMVVEEMRSNGHNPKQQIEAIQSLQGKVKNEDLPVEERKAYYQEYRQTVMDFQQAQQEVMEQDNVQSAREDLNESMLVAMQEQNPRTEDLIADIKQKQQALMEIRRSVMTAQ